jgi:DNA-binding transcriptional ArsR family regulator
MSIRNPKKALYEQFAVVAKALGHPQRLELIEHLAQGPRSVDLLASKLDLPIANVSQHLQTLRRAGLVLAERDGKYVNYRLADETVLSLFASVRTVAERHLAEVDRIVRGYFEARDDMEPVTREQLALRMRDGLVTVIDVRPPDEFALGHLPSAINVPLSELEARLREIDADREVVAYCRGPWCVLSFASAVSPRGAWRTDCQSGRRRECLLRQPSSWQGPLLLMRSRVLRSPPILAPGLPQDLR